MSNEKPFESDSTVVGDSAQVAGFSGGRRPPRLELVQGPGAPREYVLMGQEIVLGRSHQATICIESGLLSRRHAVVQAKGPEFRLLDLDSANGVYVNGVRVHGAVLCEGDAIQMGDVVLVFREGS